MHLFMQPLSVLTVESEQTTQHYMNEQLYFLVPCDAAGAAC